ncbi:unnamed protein product, partial [Sphacelaria rigidula]
GDDTLEHTSLTEVEKARMGVLSSTDAYLFTFGASSFKTTTAAPPTTASECARGHTAVAPAKQDAAHDTPVPYPESDVDTASSMLEQGRTVDETTGTAVGAKSSESELRLVYLWLGREAGSRARAAVKAQ